MKRTFVVSLLRFRHFCSDSAACASDQGQKPEETKKPEKPKEVKDTVLSISA